MTISVITEESVSEQVGVLQVCGTLSTAAGVIITIDLNTIPGM